jgi:uncharacterized membrane protein
MWWLVLGLYLFSVVMGYLFLAYYSTSKDWKTRRTNLTLALFIPIAALYMIAVGIIGLLVDIIPSKKDPDIVSYQNLKK